MFSQIKDVKHIEWDFHSVALVMPNEWDLVVLLAKHFSVGICDGAPSTAHSSLKHYFQTCFMRNLNICASL